MPCGRDLYNSPISFDACPDDRNKSRCCVRIIRSWTRNGIIDMGLEHKKILTIMLRSISTSYYCQYSKYITVGFFNLTIHILWVGAKCFLYYSIDNRDMFGLFLKCHINTSVGNFCGLTEKMMTFYCGINYLFLTFFYVVLQHLYTI